MSKSSGKPVIFKTQSTVPRRPWFSLLKIVFGGGAAVVGVAALLLLLGFAVAYPKLPDVRELQSYHPKLPLRIYAQGGELIGEFGEEKRKLVRFQNIPKVVKEAVLAVEDARFYEHSGIDSIGLARALVANLTDFKSQGASTITMQVARNVYLNSEKTVRRKLYEMMLTHKLESVLGKDQIFEIYLNQIYLGNRSYGFAAASEAYFGKPLAQITLAEAAMLAGLPKAPSAYNPLRNFARAKERQLYVLARMQNLGFITPEQAQEARAQKLVFTNDTNAINNTLLEAQYPAELARQIVFAQYGPSAYIRGLNVYTSVNYPEQKAAYQAVRSAVLNYDRTGVYRGPEQYIELSQDPVAVRESLVRLFNSTVDSDDMRVAVVMQAQAKEVVAELSSGDMVVIQGKGLRRVRKALEKNVPKNERIVRGAVIRVQAQPDGTWWIVQMPQVQAALVALSAQNGAIRAMIGGFDFGLHQFNRATQAWRQPGSSFKPFVYSAALEWGVSPSTIVNDAPVQFTDMSTGDVWVPKNYDDKFDGLMTVSEAIAKSKNMVSIQVLNKISPKQAQNWITNFGFDAKRHPPYLTMALGAGSVTPLQMAAAYAVFANGGLRVHPWLIEKIVNHNGIVLQSLGGERAIETNRVIPKRNAFIMNTMLNGVTRDGTAKRAQQVLKRNDLYGKTGTTNDSMDAWFVGFQPSVVAAAWVGYDNPRSLGKRGTGGGLALPIWLDFMKVALADVGIQRFTSPQGVRMGLDGTWYYSEYADRSGITSIGLEESLPDWLSEDNQSQTAATVGAPLQPQQLPSVPPVSKKERNQLLDLFKEN